jgi:hypothetical protein
MSQAVTHKYFLLHHFDRHSSQQNFFRFRPGIWWTSLPHSRQRLHAELDLSICWYAESCVKMWLSGFCRGESGFVRIMYRQINIYQGRVQAGWKLSGFCPPFPYHIILHYGLVLWTLLLGTIDTLAPYHGHYNPVRWTLLLRTTDTIARYDGHFSPLR